MDEIVIINMYLCVSVNESPFERFAFPNERFYIAFSVRLIYNEGRIWTRNEFGNFFSRKDYETL